MSGHLRVIASVRSLYTEVIFMQSQVNFSYFYGEESEQFGSVKIYAQKDLQAPAE